MNGFLLIDKPTGCTSFDVVRQVKRVFKTKKVGHAGTLDPDASGLLLIAVNHATRLLRFLELEPKTYEFEVVLGIQTNTDDAVGEVIKSAPFSVTKESILKSVPAFSGVIKQRPPIFSAIHIKGERAYKKARAGEDFLIPEREVEVFELQCLDYQDGVIQMRASVSSGTYVRSLARDLGEYLGTMAHARAIRRTHLSNYKVSDAQPFDEFNLHHLLQSAEILRDSIPLVEIPTTDLVRIRKGMQINISSESQNEAFVGLCVDGVLYGVAEVKNESTEFMGCRIQPRVVFPN